MDFQNRRLNPNNPRLQGKLAASPKVGIYKLPTTDIHIRPASVNPVADWKNSLLHPARFCGILYCKQSISSSYKKVAKQIENGVGMIMEHYK